MNKITAVFDINHFFHTEYSVWSLRSNGAIRDERDEASLMAGLAARFAATVSKLPASQVVVCADSRSWRKGVEMPKTPENPEGIGYKGSREEKKSKTMDKETIRRFHGLIDEFGRIVAARGMAFSCVDGLEGDDLVAEWSRRLNASGVCCLAVTGDGDVCQIVNADWDAGIWTVVWSMNSNSNKLFVPKGWKERVLSERKATIFDMGGGAEDMMKQLVSSQQMKVVDTDPAEVTFEKVMMGDDGDDVPSVWSVKTKTKKGGERVVRVTPKILKDAVTWMRENGHVGMGEIPDLNDGKKVWVLCGAILRIMGGVDGVEERKEMMSRVRANMDLVQLSPRQPDAWHWAGNLWSGTHLPGWDLYEAAGAHISSLMESVEPERSMWTRDGLLAGTRFEGGVAEKKFDPLAFVDQGGMQ